MTKIAVVGAGLAGLTIAYDLRDRPLDVTIFEKSRGFGGRAATRGRAGCRYDHGAPFFSPSTERVERLVTAHLPTEDLRAIDRPVGTFDEDGSCRLPSRADPIRPRWTYTQGISTLGKLLARQCHADIRRNTRIERLARRGDQWRLHTDSVEGGDGYDAVVLTAPAPQSAALLRPVEEREGIESVQKGLESVHYTSQFAYVLAYDRLVERPGEVFGLRGPEQGHPLDWIGFESDKPGHAPAGQTVLVLHSSGDWTAPRVDEAPEAFWPEVREAAETVLSASLREPTWTDTQRWRYARRARTPGLEPTVGAEEGLFLAGETVAEESTVSAAIESGFDVAARLRNRGAA